MTIEELENLEKVKFEIDKNAVKVDDGICPGCNEKLVKTIENRDIGNWVTLHITKLKCPVCGKEYFDLEQGKKYTILLMLEKAFRQPVGVLSKKVEKLIW